MLDVDKALLNLGPLSQSSSSPPPPPLPLPSTIPPHCRRLFLGRFGRYQMIVFNLCTASWTFCAMQMMSMAFTNTPFLPSTASSRRSREKAEVWTTDIVWLWREIQRSCWTALVSDPSMTARGSSRARPATSATAGPYSSPSLALPLPVRFSPNSRISSVT